MARIYLLRIRDFLIFALLQVLIFSHIHLLGYATAYIYLIFLLKLPTNTSRNELLVWGFLMGLVVDIFADTPGMNASAATAMMFIRNYILKAFTHKVKSENFTPGIVNLKWGGYTTYALLCVVIFYAVLYIIEMFCFSHPLTLAISIGSSTLLTMLFVLVTDLFYRK